jgi:predicted alpha/beta superfamily hydrolase
VTLTTKHQEHRPAPGTFQPLPMPPEMLRRTQYFEVDSVKTGARYAIWVTLPHDYDKDPKRSFPTIYMPDGNGMALVAAAASGGNASELIMPLQSTIQVCVGYAGEDVAMSLAVRARDLLPPKEYLAPGLLEGLRGIGDDGWIPKAMAQLYADNLENPAGDRFLAFISEELHPFVAKRWRVDAGELGLFGHSYGGLFAAYAALQPRTIFRYFGASSPGIAIEHSVIYKFYRDAVAAGGISPRELHMTVASLELTVPGLYQGMVGGGTVEFMRVVGMTPLKGLNFTSAILKDETHISVITPAFYSYLRTFFRPKG